MTNVEAKKPRGQVKMETLANFITQELPDYQSRMTVPLYKTTGVWWLHVFHPDEEERKSAIIAYYSKHNQLGFTENFPGKELGFGGTSDEVYLSIDQVKQRLLFIAKGLNLIP